MADIRLISRYISESGFKMSHLAKAMNMTDATFHSRLCGKTSFKVEEAERLAGILHLSMLERDTCFFDREHRFDLNARKARRAQERRERYDKRAARADKNGPAPVRDPAVGTQPHQPDVARSD